MPAPPNDAKIEAAADANDAAPSVDATDAPSDDPYRDAVLADAPLAYYRLNEADATLIVKDEMGTYPGHFIGTVTPGVAGAVAGPNRALQMDGKGGVDLGNHFGFGSGPFAIEVWLKANLSTTYQRVFSHQVVSPPDGYTFLFLPDKVAFQRYRSSQYVDDVSFPSPALGAFQHVVVSVDATSLTLFVNGQQVKSGTAGGIVGEPAVPFSIGGTIRATGELADGFHGVIDELAIYAHALAASRAAAHYAAAHR